MPKEQWLDAGLVESWLKKVEAERDQFRSELEAANQLTERLKSWIKCAGKFTWAHERNCPRHDSDAECNCGLDRFLASPKQFIESYEIKERALLRQVRSE